MDEEYLPLPPARISELQYKLRCAARLPHARVLRAYEMDNPKLHQQFQHEASGVKLTYAWIPVNKLSEENDWNKLHQRGFTLNPCVADRPRFSFGNLSRLVESTHLPVSADVGDETEHAIVLCKLCIRSPYVVRDSFGQFDCIPEDYDALAHSVQSNEDPIGDESDMDDTTPSQISKKEPFAYEYVLRSASQILPVALIVFRPDEGLLRQACAECDRMAHYFHQKTENYLCSDCVAPLMKMKTMKEFLIPMDNINQHSLLDFCAEHPDEKATHFCAKCNQCVCIKCKIQGGHSAGEHMDHVLVKVCEAFEDSKRLALTGCGSTDEFMAKLRSDQDEIDSRQHLIERNIADCKYEIQRWCDSLIEKVNDLGMKKLDRLRSLRHIVSRKAEAVDWNESFLREIATKNPPVDFLACWPEHHRLRNDLLKEGVTHPVEEFADLSIRGMQEVQVSECRLARDDAREVHGSPRRRFNNQPTQKLPASVTKARTADFDEMSEYVAPSMSSLKKPASKINRSPFPNVLISSDLSPRSLLSHRKIRVNRGATF